MPFVQRTEGGEITGLYSMKQPGYAEEYLPESDVEVVAFRQRMNPPQQPDNQSE